MNLSKESRNILDHQYLDGRHYEITRAILKLAWEDDDITERQLISNINAPPSDIASAIEELISEGHLKLSGSENKYIIAKQAEHLTNVSNIEAIELLRCSPCLLSDQLSIELSRNNIARMVYEDGIRSSMKNTDYVDNWFSISAYNSNDYSYSIVIPSGIYLDSEKFNQTVNGKELVHEINRSYQLESDLPEYIIEALNDYYHCCYYYNDVWYVGDNRRAERHRLYASRTQDIIKSFMPQSLDIIQDTIDINSYPIKAQAANGRSVSIKLVNKGHLLFFHKVYRDRRY